MPQLHDFQFFKTQRLSELYEKEVRYLMVCAGYCFYRFRLTNRGLDMFWSGGVVPCSAGYCFYRFRLTNRGLDMFWSGGLVPCSARVLFAFNITCTCRLALLWVNCGTAMYCFLPSVLKLLYFLACYKLCCSMLGHLAV